MVAVGILAFPSLLFLIMEVRLYRDCLEVGPRLRECCRQGQAEVVKKQQTWGLPFDRALYVLDMQSLAHVLLPLISNNLRA